MPNIKLKSFLLFEYIYCKNCFCIFQKKVQVLKFCLNAGLTLSCGGGGVQADPLEVSGEVNPEQEQTHALDHAPLGGVRVEAAHLLLGPVNKAGHVCSEGYL